MQLRALRWRATDEHAPRRPAHVPAPRQPSHAQRLGNHRLSNGCVHHSIGGESSLGAHGPCGCRIGHRADLSCLSTCNRCGRCFGADELAWR
eukprot:2022544-Prymnesium_polylepis.1